VRFAFIEVERAWFPVAMMCRVLEVSRAGFYAWRGRPEAARAGEDRRLAVEVASIYAESRQRYGSPRVHAELRSRGKATSRKRVAKLMSRQGLRARCKRRFRTTTDSAHEFPVASNILKRNFEVDAPNRTWVTDITYIWTHEGWLYLAVILDLFSRRVVGWAMSEQITRKLALNALNMALSRRQPPHGLIHHSDRGSQYASGDYRRMLAANHIVCSMSRRGDCWDNAVAESFFSTIKLELVYESEWATRAEARAAIFEYLEVFYNGERRHSSLDYLSPAAFERRHHEESLAA
jgi:transposase InsO family protein